VDMEETMQSAFLPDPFGVRKTTGAKLKVLLALPIREGNFQITPDCGILYLGSLLEQFGHRVTLLDCPKEGFNFGDFKTFVREGDFDVVGFRSYSRDHNYVNHHASLVKSIKPSTLTLVGGPHPSALPEYVLANMANIDFAWSAEAEEGMPSLLGYFSEYGQAIPEKLLATVPGLVWKSKEEARVVVNKSGFGVDLDSYNPNWDLLKPETYPGFEQRKTVSTRIWDGLFHVSTTRGCPYPCTYCNAPNLSGKKLRHRSVGKVIEELFYLKERYGAKRFSIIDDEFTLSKKYATSFCEGLIDAKVGLRWDCPNGVRMDTLYPELLQLMEKAGCESLCVGIESGNERVQKLIKKKVTVDTIRERAHMIKDSSNISITGYFMIGFLDETEEEIEETIDFAARLPLTRAAFNVVIPIPGTQIFDELIEANRLKIEDINWDTLTNDQVAFQRNHVSGKRLMELQRAAFFKFYSRPTRLLQVGKETLRNRKVLGAAIQKLRRLARKSETYTFVPMYRKPEYATV
jgi:anaerobic magnesium-protoporphyrin IX monomethyl ester cyclase